MNFEAKHTYAATQREAECAMVKEADKLIKEASSVSDITEGVEIMKGAMISAARRNPIGMTKAVVSSMIRETTLAMHVGSILAEYSLYTGPVTDIQVPVGEADEKTFFLALPTEDGATITFQNPETLLGVPDNFLTRVVGQDLNATCLPADQYAATLTLYVNGIRMQSEHSKEAWYMTQHGFAIIILKALALTCFAKPELQCFPKDLADAIDASPYWFKKDFAMIIFSSMDQRVNALVNAFGARLHKEVKSAQRKYTGANTVTTAQNIAVSFGYNEKAEENRRIECLEQVHKKIMEVVPKATQRFINGLMNDQRLTFGGVEPGTSTLAAYIKHMEYVDRVMATAQADMERVNISQLEK